MSDALVEMSRKRLGMTAVVDEGDRLLGVFTDGDLRRALDDAGFDLRGTPVLKAMTRNPKTIGAGQARGGSRAPGWKNSRSTR